MNDLQQLYQEVIIDHNKCPRNFYVMEHAHCQADGYNPLCGDQLTVYLHLKDDIISELSFVGKGCAISVASASIMTDYLRGKTIQEAENIFEEFHQGIISDNPASMAGLGKLAILQGVHNYPSRIKCATLAWHALKAALTHQSMPVSTE